MIITDTRATFILPSEFFVCRQFQRGKKTKRTEGITHSHTRGSLHVGEKGRVVGWNAQEGNLELPMKLLASELSLPEGVSSGVARASLSKLPG